MDTLLKYKAHSFFNTMSLAGLLSACAYSYLAYHSQYYGHARLFDLWVSCGIAIAVCLLTWFYYFKTDRSIPIVALLFWALIFRIIGIYAFPVLEDDFYRYLWDGFRFVSSGSPYIQPPSEFFADNTLNDSFEHILGSIGYPDFPTVYGPACQWLFALSYLIAPGESWPMQLILSLLDILLILFLLRLAPTKYVLLYAWNPLVIKEIAFTAHPDILGVFFLFAAFMSRKYIFYAAVLIAIAVASKIFALIIAPLILGLCWRAWLVFIVALLFVSAPFLVDATQMTVGLQTMAELWLFNSPIYMLLLNIFPSIWVKLVMLIIFTSIWSAYVLRYLCKKSSENVIPRGDLLFGLLLICMPVANPWYLLWLLPFSVIYPSYWAWVASFAVFLSYAIGLNMEGGNLAAYQQPVWAISLEYGLIVLAILADFTFSKYKHKYKTK